jgi:heptose-I-phosphate ethanolaminephosphotransferase
MKFLIRRIAIGLAGLGTFWLLGMINSNELLKSSVLLTSGLLGLCGLCFLGRERHIAASRIATLLYLLFFIDAAIKGFLRDYFGLRPNHVMVLQAVFDTNAMETREFFIHNWHMLGIVTVTCASLVILALLLQRWCQQREQLPVPALAGLKTRITVLTALASFLGLHFNPTMARENPLLFWPIRYSYYQQQQLSLQRMQHEIAVNMAPRQDWQVHYDGEAQHTVVLVIGESMNRGNMSLYGYPRSTTPLLVARRAELIVFQDVISPDATTLPSMMKMLTSADLQHPALWQSQPDVLQIAKEAGYKVFWLSNQTIGDGWISLTAQHADTQTFINHGSGRGENNLDGNLLEHVGNALSDPASLKFLIVHLLGAHPTYDMRYPSDFARFDDTEDAVSAALKEADRSLWVRYQRDRYDNAVAYNDFVIDNLISRLAVQRPGHAASLIYASDHGQEVGHYRDHAGHSSADNSGYEIPMLIWSNQLKSKTAQEKAAIEQRPYQTDTLNHTLLGLLRTRSSTYQPQSDILHDEFQPTQRFLDGRPYQALSERSRPQ